MAIAPWESIHHIADADPDQRLAAGALQAAYRAARAGDGDARAWLLGDDPLVRLYMGLLVQPGETVEDVRQRFAERLEAA